MKTILKSGRWELRVWHRERGEIVYHGFNLYCDGESKLTMGNDRDAAIKTFWFYAESN